MEKRSLGRGVVSLAVLLAFVGFAQASWAADTTPPTGSIVINNNRSATNLRDVTLKLTWNDGEDGSGVSRMRFSDDGSHWTAWEVLAVTRAYTLPTGPDGHRTVRVQFLDKANNRSLVYSDYIRLDTIPPTGTIIINCGGATTVPSVVHLGLTWSDSGAGVSRMRFSDNGSTWTAWTPVAAESTHHTLLEGLGYRTVRVQYLDGAGNYSSVYSDYIKVVAPTEETLMLPGDVPLVLVKVTGGSFLMGRYPDEPDSDPSEDPQHQVTLSSFWMSKYEVTKGQWLALMDSTPWVGQGVIDDADSPAVFVSWNDATSFVSTLSASTGAYFRLPSEAQWEYACRAGMTTRFYWGDDLGYAAVTAFAWDYYHIGDEYYAHRVGQKLPNAFGLFDLSGNAQELCADWWHWNYNGAPTDGSVWQSSGMGNKVVRGGSFSYYQIRSATRYMAGADFQTDVTTGFRVIRTL